MGTQLKSLNLGSMSLGIMDVNILNETRIEVLFQMCFVIMVQITKVFGVGCNIT